MYKAKKGLKKGNIWDTPKYAHLGYKGNDSDHPLYSTYRGIVDRCEQKSNRGYAVNLVRGVRVCSRWRMSFSLFVYDMGNRPSPMHYLKRHNTHRDYDKVNCYWAVHDNKTNDMPTSSKAVTYTLHAPPSLD